MTKAAYYIGLMSGTSADGIDLALVDFSQNKPHLIYKYYQPYDDRTHQAITSLYVSGSNEIDRAFELDVQLAYLFSEAITELLKQCNLSANDISAIGNHGQTIRHRPQPSNEKHSKHAFTLQIGCNQTLATLTNIRVIGQFRKKDMALGGQGAPLVPAFHQALFTSLSTHPKTDIFVVNIGGIANISFLPSSTSKQGVIGFDTGPGNALMDDWYQQHHQNGRYDKNGDWAAQGHVDQILLTYLLTDNYFRQPAPKSTGREAFHLDWLKQKLAGFSLTPVDVQATLAMLTAKTICDDILKYSQSAVIYLCGGGVLNKNLFDLIDGLLKQKHHNFELSTTDVVNIDSDALEAMAFAWFAFAFDHQIVGNIPAVTGASKATILGNNYAP
jgi:anhydro-N-acetylmuramic acid kinase